MRVALLGLAAAAGMSVSALASTTGSTETRVYTSGSPIADVLAGVDADVRIFNDHLVTLASPYMEGRVPGSAGMERAKDYFEFHLRRFGLEPAFPEEINGERVAFATYRDPFPLGGAWTVHSETFTARGAGRAIEFEPQTDFLFTGLGSEGEATGEAVFVGYSINGGPGGYSTYAEGDDLSGKIAVMFRFEPMSEAGRSLWTEDGSWSDAASFSRKVSATAERNPAGIVIVNTPGAADDRAGRISRFGSGGGDAEVPVIMVTPEAAERMITLADIGGRTLLDLRHEADDAGGIQPLGMMLTIAGDADREELIAENVGGLFPGVGDLADEYIVVGAHLDHLGMGYFGSRTGPGALHPGADDNASGSAALLLLAEKLQQTFAEWPEATPRRSVLIIAFDGEESGLNGSRHYVRDPIAPAGQHALMINWDMIGRIVNERLTVAGAGSGEGLLEFIQPHLDASGLEIVLPERMSGASDHTSFYQAEIPVLFSIIADFHSDYHTPEDVAWKINRLGAAKAVRMYHNIVKDVATHPERFAFKTVEGARRGGAMANIRIRFGVMPGNYDEDEPGIPVGAVTPGSSAALAGVIEGDRLVRWDGQKITDVMGWMEMLGRHEPGDEINIGVLRDGAEISLPVTLQGR